ncbi:MAG: heavy-metal-associated domain-containing protein [Gammaproteobacteria bacterium]|nr:heavy-metal-associated domain-containing protein [Gammaproteobacteria bacterium]
MIQTAQAAGTQYEMRVDGLACPFCAYGIEKKLKAIEGTSNISVDLNKGLVKVEITEGKSLTEDRMKKLFNDSGFTYRSMKKKSL